MFGSRQILWSTSWKNDSGVGKGLIRMADGDLLAGTYCDLTKINTGNGTVAWMKPIMEKQRMRNLSTSPALIARDGNLLIGTTDGILYSINPGTGKEVWSYKTGAYSTEPLQAADGTIYVQKGKDIAALKPDGTEKFQVPIGFDRLKICCVDASGSAYVQSEDMISAIGPDGKRRWKEPGRTLTSFESDPGRLYATDEKQLPHPEHKGSTIFHTLVSARDPGTGRKLWENEYDYATVGGYHDNLLYVYEHDRISALDASNGKSVWESPGQWMRKLNTILDDGTVILSGHGQFEALDGKTGTPKWTLDVRSLPLDSEAHRTRDGNIIIADYDNIYSVDPSNGKVNFKMHMEKGIHRILVSDDERTVYAEESETGIIHAVDFRNPGEIARDLAKEAPGEVSEGGEGVIVEDEFIVIDGVKVPVHKGSRRRRSQTR